MDPMENKQQLLERVARELGAAMHRQAGTRWGAVRTARRNLGNRHVWRFRTANDPDRFLVLSHRAMTTGDNPVARLLAQLEEQGWLDRLQRGPQTQFRLGSRGRLQARPLE